MMTTSTTTARKVTARQQESKIEAIAKTLTFLSTRWVCVNSSHPSMLERAMLMVVMVVMVIVTAVMVAVVAVLLMSWRFSKTTQLQSESSPSSAMAASSGAASSGGSS